MKQLRVEIADSHIKREYGLKNRKHLAKNSGMLFKFPYAARLSFWMRDTYIPLDIAFINDGGRIVQIEEMKPLSTKPIYASVPCRYALEVNKGWFLDNNICIGSLIQGEGITKTKGFNVKAQIDPVLEEQYIDDTQTDVVDNIENMQPTNIPEEVDPDVMLNMSFEDIINDAEYYNKTLVIIYQKKDGYVLPPKNISGPFIFEEDEFGNANAVVKCWDEQDAAWKSFLIDNILSLDYVVPEGERENIMNTEGILK